MSCWKLRERERVELLICHMCGAKRRNEEASSLIFFWKRETQPPTVVCKMEDQLEYMHIAYAFLHVWLRFL